MGNVRLAIMAGVIAAAALVLPMNGEGMQNTSPATHVSAVAPSAGAQPTAGPVEMPADGN